MERLYKDFGKMLAGARQAAGLSQMALAKRVGLTRTSITNIEQGNQRLALHTVYLLAAAVGLDPEDLLPSTSAADSPSTTSQLSAGVLREISALSRKEQQWVKQIVADETPRSRT